MSEWIKNTGKQPNLSKGTLVDVHLQECDIGGTDAVEAWEWDFLGSGGAITEWRVSERNVVANPEGTNTVGDAVGVSPERTNPKQSLGQASLPLNLFSPLATAYGCIGKLNGRLKYGGNNFVATPVIASIYCDAIRRHLDKWMAGQEFDSADGVPHFAAMLANIDILICARAAGTLVDDRAMIKGYEDEMDKLTPMVKALQELHKDKNPHHYLLSEIDAN